MQDKVWLGYTNGKVYKFSQLALALNEILDSYPETVIKGTYPKAIQYFNIPASFDIETSSFYVDEETKAATMYIWQLGINGTIIYGRTWNEFKETIDEITKYFDLHSKRRMIIYVHNLGYEFQFMRKYFKWDKVFAIKQRRPVQCITGGIEFRCSLFLSNYSLEYLGANLLHKYPVQKLVGNLDYSKLRHSHTPLTKAELDYCFNDVRVVMSYIQEKIEQDGDITQIPLTNTGYVRNYCRKECFYQGIPENDLEARKRVQLNYKAIMKSLVIDTEEEYEQLKRGFMGGFTHASILYSGKVMNDVGSADLTSSYPFCMVAEYFPMSKGQYIGSINDNSLFNYYLQKYCCIFDIEFTNLRPAVEYETPISQSRSYIEGESIINNGRVVSADKLTTTMTELDYDTISKFYEWDSVKIMNFRIYSRGYLPRALILSVLNLYGDKTSLKGVDGKEVEYMVSKNMINASFGMMVTAIVRDEFEYADEWFKKGANVDSQLADYNKSFNRFLFYGWGVWVTAHARHNLFTAIHEFGHDYVYSDTDSIKGINFEDHLDYFKKYNDAVFDKLLAMCNYYKIPFSMCQPETKNGEKKLIGLWDFEEGYKRFKTVGAKRYMFEKPNGKLSMTVSGLNKKFAIPWLLQDNDYDHDVIFHKFGEGMFIPAGHTGKLTMTYIDEKQSGTLVDYLGNEAPWEEESATHMEPQSYLMSLVTDYLKFLEGVQYVEY